MASQLFELDGKVKSTFVNAASIEAKEVVRQATIEFLENEQKRVARVTDGRSPALPALASAPKAEEA